MSTEIRDEARSLGTLGLAALEMMRGVFTTQLRRFPTLRDTETIDDFVNSFFEEKGAGYVNVIATLPDDRAARQTTVKWAERWLIDRARKQPWGALRNRLEKRLERDGQFKPSSAAHYWYLAGDQDIDRLVTGSELDAIAAQIEVEVFPQSGGGPVRLGRPGQLEEMLRALLTAAGRLHISELTRICADRFPSLLETGDAILSTTDTDWDAIEDTTPALDTFAVTDSKARNERIAKELLPRLTESERTAIRLGGEATAIAKELGIGRTSAYNMVQRLRARLIELAGSSDRSPEVLAALVRLVMDDSPGVPSQDNMNMEDSNVV
ncbi:hypothetical protein [Leifsonia sp. RAF41]|uniref:hypothetical protein n=1 Tax=Leifsonia sp. RAF41 TaxID=3233056 RepID=UPI003F9BED6B